MSDIIKNNNSSNIKNKSIESSKTEPEKIKSIQNLKKNSHTFYNIYKSSSSECINKKFPTINLLNRNLLSINNSNFDYLKKVKSQSTIYQVEKNENNYLNPLSDYSFINNEMKENQKRNNINSLAWLNIIKNKLFSIDINSKVKKGKNISRNQFYEQKNKITIPQNKIINNNNNDIKSNENKVINSYQYKNKDILKNTGVDYKFNSSCSMDNIFNSNRFKINSNLLNKKKMNFKEYFGDYKENIDYWKKLKLKRNKSLDMSFDEILKENSSQNLKSNFLYFDKNHNSIIRHKNWWKINS